MIDKFQHLAKNNDGFRELLGYLKNNKKSFDTVAFYKDFKKKKANEKEKDKKFDKVLAPKPNSYLDEDDILDVRYEIDRDSFMTSPHHEETKLSNTEESEQRSMMREIQLQKGKVRSTYIMKNNQISTRLNESGVSIGNDVTKDFDTLCVLDSDGEMTFRIIRHQMKNSSHPIRVIINKFSTMYERAYKMYIDKSATDSDKLYQRLESVNEITFSKAPNGKNLKRLHTMKRKSAKLGKISEADRIKISNYFLTDQAVGDVQIFIQQMVSALIYFYSIVVKQNTLENMKEELLELTTDWVLTGNMQKIVFTFFKLECEDKRKILIDKYKEYINICPEHV
jgi:hypothetical protein